MLTAQQQKFIDAYVLTLNGTQSAIEAGYATSSAHVSATRLLKLDKIQSAISVLTAKAKNKHIATVAEVQEFWTATFNDSKQTMANRLIASDKLARAHGLFLDRMEVTEKVIEVALPEIPDES